MVVVVALVLLMATVACSDDGGPDGAVATEAGQEHPFGEWIPSELADEEDVQTFTFPATRGERIRVVVHSPDPRALDPMVRLLDPDGEVIVENDDIEVRVNRNAELVGSAVADEAHSVEVEAYDGSGDFELIVERGDMVGDAAVPVERWTDDERQLKRRIAEGMRSTCRPEEPFDTELAVLGCLDSDGEPVTVSSYRDAATMEGDYAGIVDFEEVRRDRGTEGDCPAEFAWVSSDEASGRVLCKAEADRTRLSYTWVCDLHVIVSATRYEGGAEDQLYRVWQREAGPICS